MRIKDLDVGRTTQVGDPSTDHLLCLLALELCPDRLFLRLELFAFSLTPLRHLNDVVAELSPHRLADLAFGQRECRLFELGYHKAAVEKAERSSLRGASVVRVFRCQLCEVRSVLQLRVYLLCLLQGRVPVELAVLAYLGPD